MRAGMIGRLVDELVTLSLRLWSMDVVTCRICLLRFLPLCGCKFRGRRFVGRDETCTGVRVQRFG